MSCNRYADVFFFLSFFHSAFLNAIKIELNSTRSFCYGLLWNSGNTRIFCTRRISPLHKCPLISSHVCVVQWHMLVYFIARTRRFFSKKFHHHPCVRFIFVLSIFEAILFVRPSMCELSMNVLGRFLAHQPKMCRTAACHTSNTAIELSVFFFSTFNLFIVVTLHTINSGRRYCGFVVGIGLTRRIHTHILQ